MSLDLLTIHTDRGPLSLPVGCTLADAVELLLQGSSREADTIATAVNGEFVARAARADHALHDGDTVLCFSPITGG
jgi:sulfur carrier protein